MPIAYAVFQLAPEAAKTNKHDNAHGRHTTHETLLLRIARTTPPILRTHANDDGRVWNSAWEMKRAHTVTQTQTKYEKLASRDYGV